MQTRSMILPNLTGDIEITWSEDQDETMRALIQKRIEAGMRFFQIRVEDGAGHRERVTDVSKLVGRRVDVDDEDVQKLFLEGKVGLGRRSGRVVDNDPKPLTDPAVIASTPNTIGVRPFAGG